MVPIEITEQTYLPTESIVFHCFDRKKIFWTEFDDSFLVVVYIADKGLVYSLRLPRMGSLLVISGSLFIPNIVIAFNLIDVIRKEDHVILCPEIIIFSGRAFRFLGRGTASSLVREEVVYQDAYYKYES